uniref:Translocon Sec61/SecY plug domain-containing protein n=2 Tax=Cannabis sativa TaxID=3483 RepID=A0A803NU28_CANSA
MGASGFRLLNMVRPFLLFLPEVQSANRKVTLREKVLYNVLALFIFLVCSQLPLYGIQSITATDSFYWMRIILVSSRGTVMELGITPILTSGFVMQVLVGSKIIRVDNNIPEDRALLENIIWKAFSPVTISSSGHGVEFEGAVIALFHQLLTRTDKVGALHEAFFRRNLPNVTNLLSTVMIFLVVVYFQGFRVLFHVRSKNAHGQQDSYPIKLFYTSNMPIILQSALVSNIYFISQSPVPSPPAPDVMIYDFLAEAVKSKLQQLVKSKLQAFEKLDPQFSPHMLLLDPTQTLSPEQQMIMPGHRESNLRKELNRYIPTAAAFDGMCIGGLTVLANLMGAIGSGTGILLAVTTIYQNFETFKKERASELGFFGF